MLRVFNVRVAWKTDKGRKKKLNEDSVLVDLDAGLFLLADGMSCPRGGNIASELAVRHAHAFLKERIGQAQGGDEVLKLMDDAVSKAHHVIGDASKKDRTLCGMGTTLMILYVRGQKGYVAHVGDSRAYRLGRELERITEDHVMEHEAHDDVMLRELFFFSRTRMLSQALGPSRQLRCDGHRIPLSKGDILLLCSDGLTNMLSDMEIRELIACHGADIDASADALIEAANRMGGRDNISVVLIQV